MSAELESERGTTRSDTSFRFNPRNIGTLVGALGALVAVVTGAVALLYQVAPGLRPQEPAERLAVEITNVVVDRNVTLGQYAERVEDPTFERDLRRALGASSPGLRREFLRRRGVIVYVQMRSHGDHGALAPPQVHFHEAGTGRRLQGAQRDTILDGKGPDAAALEERRLECKLRATEDQCVAAVFKLCDVHVERVRIRVELSDTEGRLMDLATSKAIPCRLLPPAQPL
jgi:hypothetical protein